MRERSTSIQVRVEERDPRVEEAVSVYPTRDSKLRVTLQWKGLVGKL